MTDNFARGSYSNRFYALVQFGIFYFTAKKTINARSWEARIVASSAPTVETRQPLAQKVPIIYGNVL
jgi:hypothetical protein